MIINTESGVQIRGDLIEKATQQLDLAEPLKRIALWAKQTGNLNSHYDPDDEPNRQTIRDQLLAARQLANGDIEEQGIVAPEDALKGKVYASLMQELEKRGIAVVEKVTGIES